MKNSRPWFALITCCTASTMLAALGLALLFASATLAFSLASSAGERNGAIARARTNASGPQKFSGVATDDRCGARHSSAGGMSSAECVRHCVRNGARYALVNGDHSYVMSGNLSELDRVAGQRVTVTGTLEGNTINVISVTAQ